MDDKTFNKAYVVMAYYHQEGWNAVAECDTFQEAVRERDKWMGMGNSRVQIFRPVEIVALEANPSPTTNESPASGECLR